MSAILANSSASASGGMGMRENIPCALYALEVTDEAYTRAKRRTQHMMHHGGIQ